MSETATVHVKEVKVVKEGTNAKGKWTLYGIVDGNDDLFSFLNNRTLYDEAKAFEDKRAEIEYVLKGDYRNLTSIKEAPATNGEHPPLGTGEYVKGQTAPSDARRILGCVAWEHAVKLADVEMRHTVGREITPAMVLGAAEHYANQIFMDLLRKGRMMEDSDIPL